MTFPGELAASRRFLPRGALICGLGAALLAGERWSRRTRASCAERRRALPGDELVPRPLWQATRAISLDAAPEAVWPWLAQMGFPTWRGGWYTPYWLDRLAFGIRAHSAECVRPELQQIAVGDCVPDSADGRTYFTVAVADPPRALVLHSHTHPLPLYRDTNFAWAFVAEPEGAGTRLSMRARIAYVPVWPAAVVKAIIALAFGAGDVIQAGAMLTGIERRVARCVRP